MPCIFIVNENLCTKVNSFLRLWLSNEFIFKFVTRWLSSVVWRLHFFLQLTKIVNGFDDFYNSKLHLVIPRCMRRSRPLVGENNFQLSFFLPRYTSQAADTVTGTYSYAVLDIVTLCYIVGRKSLPTFSFQFLFMIFVL